MFFFDFPDHRTYQEIPMMDYQPPDGSTRGSHQNRFSAGDLYQPPENTLQRTRSEFSRRPEAQDTDTLVEQLPSKQLGKLLTLHSLPSTAQQTAR